MVVEEFKAKVGSGNTSRVTATGSDCEGGIIEMETCPVFSEQQMGLLLVEDSFHTRNCINSRRHPLMA